MDSRFMRLGLVCVMALTLLLSSAGAAFAIAPDLVYDLSAPGNTAPLVSQPEPPFYWYNVPVTLTLHRISWGDPISGGIFEIASAHYTRNDGPEVAIVPTSTVSFTADGVYYVSCQGLNGPPAGTWVGIDHTPPVSTLRVTAADAAGTVLPILNGTCWSRTDAFVSMSSTDGPYASGPATTYCSYDSCTPYSFVATFTLSTEGLHPVCRSAVDVAGNAEASKTVTVGIDRTPPLLSIATAGTYMGPATITANASDTISGLGHVELRLDSASSWQTGQQITASTLGLHVVYARAFDVAGNMTEASAAFAVLPPAATKTSLSCASRVKVKKSLKLSGAVSPGAAPGKVTIAKSRLVGKKWKSAGFVQVGIAKGKFTYSFKPTAKGKWRFSATYSGGVVGATTYASSKSSVKTVKVK